MPHDALGYFFESLIFKAAHTTCTFDAMAVAFPARCRFVMSRFWGFLPPRDDGAPSAIISARFAGLRAATPAR